MKGYIYTMYAGADPSHGWVLSDPIFGATPTLGACVPHIRRAVAIGDHIFVVSGRVPGAKQYVVGGFEVAEKIDALTAFRRFPEYRLKRSESGQVLGNIIVDGRGRQNPLDEHEGFGRRVEDYVVGRNPVTLETSSQFRRAREETIEVLSEVFGRGGTRVFDIIGRYRKMDEPQVRAVRAWLKSLTG